MVSNSKKVINGISSQTLVTIMLGVVEIGSFAIMSRLLTKEDFGYYAAIMAIVTIFSSFSETGIGSAIVQQKKLNQRYVDNAFTLSLIFGLCISSALLLSSKFLANVVADESMIKPLMVMALTLLLNCMTSVFSSLIHRRLEFLRLGSINLFSLLFTTIIAIWLAYKGYGYYAIMTKAVLQSVLVCMLTFFLCKTRFHLAFDILTYKKIFKFSGWLMASVVFRNIAHQVDKLLMPKLLSVSTLGAYNRPKDFINNISSKLNGIFDTALFPVLSSIQDDIPKLQKAFQKSLYLLNLFAVLLALSFAVNSELLIRIFFGEEWLSLKYVAMVLSLALVFNIDGRLSDCYLRSMALTKEQFYFRVFEAVIKIIGVLLGYSWGIMGVAVSVVVTNTIAKLVKIVYVATKIQITTTDTIVVIFKSWKFAIIVVPICIFASYTLPEGLIGNIFLAIVYIALIVFLFIFCPSLVGRFYSNTQHPQIMSFIKNKLHVN